MKKKLTSILCVVLALCTLLCTGAMAAELPNSGPTVRVNGQVVSFPDGQPFIDNNGRTMIPVRFVTEQLGATVTWDGKTQTANITKNGIKLTSPAKVMGSFLAVVFSPVHLSLVKDGPYERRRFLDAAISQLKPKYALALSGYNKALAQRNMLLKDLMYHSELYDTLDVWEEQIAFYAAELMIQRIGYIHRLSTFATEIYGGISGKRETLEITYQEAGSTGGNTKEEIRQGMRDLLRAARKTDLVTGSTSVGPHRDDLLIKINDLSARSYGSQGQQRSAALALKLGEAAVIRSFTGEQPVALLDDVMSELDSFRQNYILNHISDWQVFITCCDPASVQNLQYGKAIRMKNGKII